MSPTETKESTTKREIQVEIPANEVARQTESLIQKYQKMARIPGFRRGHVPASIIRQRFSEEIKTDMVEALIPRYFRQETERLGMHPISQPQVTDLHLHDGEPLRFKAAFEVLPDVKVEGYKELRADKPEITVSDSDVEQALTDLREQQATFSPIEGRALWRMGILPRSLSMELRSLEKGSRCTWMKCWSRSPGRTRCPSSPRTCAVRTSATSAPST